MKKKECRMCGPKPLYCKTGEHIKTPGKIHTGRGALADAEWDCPNCLGRGFILLSIVDRIALAFYIRGQRVFYKIHPRT